MTTALLHLVAAALVLSGLDKLRSPRAATEAWTSAGLPSVGRLWGDRLAGLMLGAAEVVIGTAALLASSRWAAAAVAGAYLGFFWFVRRLSAMDSNAACGCFGASSAPPGRAHLALDLGGAAAALTAVAFGAEPIADVFAVGLAAAIPYATLLATGALVLLLGPALSAELTHVRSRPSPRTFAIDTDA